MLTPEQLRAAHEEIRIVLGNIPVLPAPTAMPTWQTGLEEVIGFTDPWHAGAAAERHCAE